VPLTTSYACFLYYYRPFHFTELFLNWGYERFQVIFLCTCFVTCLLRTAIGGFAFKHTALEMYNVYISIENDVHFAMHKGDLIVSKDVEISPPLTQEGAEFQIKKGSTTISGKPERNPTVFSALESSK
jgi:hypothetical protein